MHNEKAIAMGYESYREGKHVYICFKQSAPSEKTHGCGENFL